MSPLPGVLVLVALAGCQPNDPAEQSARQYASSLEPLLAENGLLFNVLLDASADVYNGKTVTAETRVSWDRDVVPLAEHLRDQGLLVLPPPEWAADHKGLVEIWTTRAEAYRNISNAMAVGDLDQWKSGRDQADTAKLAEEEWFRGANSRLSPYGIVLDQFP
jgi:hypothetical protein